ncbi:hypothetical protein ACS0TY_020917 [Phlomoides rotata]
MVRPPSIDSNGMKKGAWSEEEDNKLRAYVLRYGHWNWRLLPKYAGLARCGKSCRLRWVNYLKPGVKRGKFSKEEEDLVTKLHSQLGNKWSVIATKLPGRTDNEVKNFYHTRIEKKKKKKKEEVRGHAKVVERESSLESTQESTPRLDTSSEEDLWSGLFPPSDANTDDYEYRFPPLMEERFFYPDLQYTELSCSDSSYITPLHWIHQGQADDDHSIISPDPTFFGDESSSISNTTSSYQNYEDRSSELGYDPLFDNCFDYGMDLFS